MSHFARCVTQWPLFILGMVMIVFGLYLIAPPGLSADEEGNVSQGVPRERVVSDPSSPGNSKRRKSDRMISLSESYPNCKVEPTQVPWQSASSKGAVEVGSWRCGCCCWLRATFLG